MENLLYLILIVAVVLFAIWGIGKLLSMPTADPFNKKRQQKVFRQYAAGKSRDWMIGEIRRNPKRMTLDVDLDDCDLEGIFDIFLELFEYAILIEFLDRTYGYYPENQDLFLGEALANPATEELVDGEALEEELPSGEPFMGELLPAEGEMPLTEVPPQDEVGDVTDPDLLLETGRLDSQADLDLTTEPPVQEQPSPSPPLPTPAAHVEPEPECRDFSPPVEETSSGESDSDSDGELDDPEDEPDDYEDDSDDCDDD